MSQWQREFNTCFSIIPEGKKKEFPEKSVRFLGYTLYNAKKRSDKPEQLYLALAHYNHARKIPDAIKEHISSSVREHLTEEMVQNSIGNNAVMHTHNTLPNMAQKYKEPMWKLPECNKLDNEDKSTISGNSAIYKATREKYKQFAEDFLVRVATLDE